MNNVYLTGKVLKIDKIEDPRDPQFSNKTKFLVCRYKSNSDPEEYFEDEIDLIVHDSIIMEVGKVYSITGELINNHFR